MPAGVTKRRFDVDEYRRMAEAGVLSRDDRVELIDGEVVTTTPIGPRHNAALARATRALVAAAGDLAIVLPQGSVRLDQFSEPQPDLVLLRPRPDFYASRLAGPPDILLVVEMAESSLDCDRDVKARMYAAAGVQEYWLVDLVNRSVSCYTEPENGSYRRVRLCAAGQTIGPLALPQCSIPVDSLLAD